MKTFVQNKWLFMFTISLSLALPSWLSALGRSSARDQGKRLYERIVGVSPSDAALKSMTDFLADGKTEEATFYAMEDLNFYKITLRQMFNILSDKDGNSDIPLSDSTALVIGLARDNLPFDQILYGDIFYSGSDELQNLNGTTIRNGTTDVVSIGAGAQTSPLFDPATMNYDRNDLNSRNRTIYDTATNTVVTKIAPLMRSDRNYSDNTHYQSLVLKFPDWPSRLVQRKQSDIWSVSANLQMPEEDIAGWLSTRQAASSFYSAGTNRRMFRYTMMNYLCKDMEVLHDTSASDEFVRADVDRRPGGSADTYQNTCRGCHAGMDAFSAAFSYFDYLNNATFTHLMGNGNGNSFDAYNGTYPAFNFNNGQNKQFRQASVWPDGFNPIKMKINKNNWKNKWTGGANAGRLGWRVPAGMSTVASGKGANQLGRVLAATEAFSACMTKRVFQKVCFRSPTMAEAGELKNIQTSFEGGFSEYGSHSANGKYNLKALFAKTANMCFGK